MYKLETKERDSKGVSFNVMLVGDLGVYLEGPSEHKAKGQVILRTYSNWVSLSNPCITWRDEQSSHYVRLLQAGDSVCLTVQREE